jgi:hypothetical protein
MQSEANGGYLEDDLAKLIPKLLDDLQVLGDLARRISHSVGGNGHCPELSETLIRELVRR